MSCHVYSYVVVGVEIATVIKSVSTTTLKKKFNEDTGKPYTLTEAKVTWFIFGKKYPENINVEGVLQKDFHKEFQIFGRYSDGYNDGFGDVSDVGPNSSKIIIGFKAHEIGPYSEPFVEIDSNRISELSTRFFNVTGIKPKTYLLQYFNF